MKNFSYAVILFLFWLTLSGHFEWLFLGFGFTSVMVAMYLAKRMNVIDHESHPLHLSPRYPLFFIYLLKEIIISNIDVVIRVMTPGKSSISPQLFKLPLKQKSDLARVIYANSITLTPGTVSVNMDKNHVTVHALSKEAASGLKTGKMSKAVQSSTSDS